MMFRIANTLLWRILEITFWGLGAWALVHHSLHSCTEAFSMLGWATVLGALMWTIGGTMTAARTASGGWGGMTFGFFFFWITVTLAGGDIYRSKEGMRGGGNNETTGGVEWVGIDYAETGEATDRNAN